MSVSPDLISMYLLDKHIQELGTTSGGETSLDLSAITGELPSELGLPTSAVLELSGAAASGPRSDESTWVEAELVKSPPMRLTNGRTGLTRKRQDYVIMVKSPKDAGSYFNQVVSDTIERHFPNNLHLQRGEWLLTVQKSYQQPNIFLDNTGRWWNRIFVECEIFYDNNK